MLLVFFTLIAGVYFKQIVYQFDANDQNKDYWVSTYNFSQCNSEYILGRNSMNVALMKNIILPSHYLIYIDLTFYRIDSWDDDLFLIYVDNKQIYQQPFQQQGSNLCGDSSNDEIIQISVQTQHYSNLAVVYIRAKDQNGDNNESWGLKSFTLSIEPCPYGCVYCEKDSYFQCKKWSLLQWYKSVTHHFYYDKFPYQMLYCASNCQFTITLPSHNKVMIRHRLYIGPTENYNLDLLINDYKIRSIPVSNNLALFQLIDVTLPFFTHIKNSIQVKIYRTGTTYTNFMIKDFQLLIQNDDDQFPQLIPGCLSIIQNTCWECEDGWILNQLISSQGFEQCTPICGDSLIVGSEQCDHGTNSLRSYNCQYQCPFNCLKCVFGVCEECREGYQLNLNMLCEPICGDGLIIPNLEYCDDQNKDQEDGCKDCQFDFFVENCIKQISNVCIECDKGYKPISNNVCIPECGDQIIIPDYEECDDGNDKQYDGCYECKYQCRMNCINCVKGVCLDKCNHGEIMVNYKCESLCGNSIVTGLEECDDGNNIQYDGCYQCQYSCPLFCDYCEKGICLECQQQYQKQNNQCISLEICGNGIVGDNEDCDDGNYQSNDGCFKCIIEENWICDNTSPSYCYSYEAAVMILTFLNKTSDIQYVKLTFSQQVKIDIYQNDLIYPYIIDVPDENQNITVYTIHNLTDELSDAEFILGIEIYQMMPQPPILEVTLKDNIVNEYNMSLFKNAKQLKLQPLIYMNPSQKQQAQKVSNFNQNIIYCLVSVSVISLFLGESSVFQDILNTLQYISYLKFINVDFPGNVIIFFQFSDLISINQLLDFMNIDYFLNKLEIQQEEQYTSGQFALYQIQTNLISNLICQFLQVIGFLFLFLIFQIIKRLFYTNLMVARFRYCISYLASKFHKNLVISASNNIYNFIRIIIHSPKVINSQFYIQILLINGWDLIFKIFMYISTIQQRPTLDYIQFSLCLFIGLIYFMVLLLQWTHIKYFKGKKQKLYQMIFGQINLIRQIILLIFLVFCQNNQIFQTISILILNLAYIFIVYSMQTFFKQPRDSVQFIIEIIVLLFTMTSLSHFKEFDQYINPDVKSLIGFIEIGILASSTATLLIYFALKQIQKLYQIIKKKCNGKRTITRARADLFFM